MLQLSNLRSPQTVLPVKDEPGRVLLLITALAVGGGAESQVARLAAELKERHWVVCVVCMVSPKGYVDDLQRLGIEVHSLDMRPGIPDPRGIVKLRAIIKEFRPDVVHSHMFHANILARVTRLFCPIPRLICTAHNLRESSRRDGPTWHKELLYGATDALADQTTIICRAGFDRYLKVRAVPRHKFQVVPNGIDLGYFRRSEKRRMKVREELGIGSEFVWLAVGRLVKQKDYPNLLHALASIQCRDFKVLVAGSGPLEAEMHKMCTQLGLDGCVRFCGTSQEILNLYSAADAFVMSSKFEGMPMALLEAAAVELPAVVTDAGGNAEVVVDKVTGFIVPVHSPVKLAQAMQQVMSMTTKQLHEMGRAAREHCEQCYRIDVVMDRWLELYKAGKPPISEQVDVKVNEAVREAPQPSHPGALVISIDFELHWGVRDIRPLDDAESKRLLIARSVIPQILDLFEQYGVHATWATVGYLFAHSRSELLAFMPSRRPNYRDHRLNSCREVVGADEREDPFHFAPSLIDEIGRRAGQEIASHSFSHYYCMEDGQAVEEFEADLQSAVAIAANSGYELRSYVFPRNQSNPAYLPYLRKAGFRSYRSNGTSSTKRAASFAEQRRPHLRIARLIDSYVNLDGFQTFSWPQHPPLLSLPASRYLRPSRPIASPFQSLLLERIRGAMQHAAETGQIFHLWWHPEDFAPYCAQNLAMLRHVLELFSQYRSQYGMSSLSMNEVVNRTMQTKDRETNHDAA